VIPLTVAARDPYLGPYPCDPPDVDERGGLLTELGELIERRCLLDAEPQAYIDTFADFPPRSDRPGWVEAEVERLDEQIDALVRELADL